MLPVAMMLLLGASQAMAQGVDGGGDYAAKGGIKVTNINLNNWNITPPSVPGFSSIRTSRDGSAIVISPNFENPNNTIGWIEGPQFGASKTIDDLQGNTIGFKIRYKYKTSTSNGSRNVPEIRLRMNTLGFEQYAIGGIAGARFVQLSSVSDTAVATVSFDRNLLPGDTTFRLYIDMVSVYPGGNVDPNWFIRIEAAELFTTVSDTAYSRSELISACYGDTSGGVWVHLGGSTERTRVETAADAFVYDGPYVAVLKNGRLRYFSGRNNLSTATEIQSTDVVSAAISDHNVMYLRSNGGLYYYDILTGEKRTVLSSSTNNLVGASGDGTMHIYDQDVTGIAKLRQYNTRLSSPSYQTLVGTNSVRFLFDRTTFRPDQSIVNKAVKSGDLSENSPSSEGDAAQ